MKLKTKILFLSAAAFLSACATGPVLAPSGAFVAEPFTLNLNQNWSAFKRKSEGVQGAALTREGLDLNMLAVYMIEEGHDLKAGKGGTQEEVDYKSGMSQLELVEFATASLASLDMKNIEVSSVETTTFAGEDGVGFDFQGFYKSGLAAKGIMRVSETDMGLAMGIYVAPTRVYYDRDAEEARRALTSARL